VVAVVVLAVVPLVVQGLVSTLILGEFAWPTGHVAMALAGLLRGHFGAGLPAEVGARLPADEGMWVLTLVADLLVLGAALVVGVRLRDLLGGPSTRHGLATSAQAAHALGLPRLRKSAAVIRPDLDARRQIARPRTGRRGPGRALSTQPERQITATATPTDTDTDAATGTDAVAGTRRCRRWLGWVCDLRRRGMDPRAAGWKLGRASRFGPQLWVPFDRTTCVVGPQGSGKTLDLLVPALLDAPGAALVTLTKPEDLFLTLRARQRDARPVAVLDPFDLAPGTRELVWDPVAGCEDPMVAERRAKAFAAGTIKGATAQSSDQAARFYAGECAKVLQAYFHAAAIAGIGLEEVLMWVSNPLQYPQAEEILRTHAGAEPLWDGLLRGALYGDERTAGNTITTVQQALALFFQRSIRERCVPSVGRPATDLTELIKAGGTVYLLGREDPYASASPLMTAVTEQILDIAKRLGETSSDGRLCPPFLACLDELPSTAPIPTLSTRMANERGLGLSFILAAQTWRQFVVCYGEDEARTIYGLSNNLVVFGGGKDIGFYRELSDLIGSVTTTQTRYSSHATGWAGSWFRTRDPSWEQHRVPILEPAELRRIPAREALVLAEIYDPIIAHLHRCIEGRRGKHLLAAQARARDQARSATSARTGGDDDHHD